MRITLYTKDKYNYWAKDRSTSDSLIKHLVGTRYVVEPQLTNIKLLANAHGWEVEYKNVEQ